MNSIRIFRIFGGFAMLGLVGFGIYTEGLDPLLDFALVSVGVLAIYIGIVDCK